MGDIKKLRFSLVPGAVLPGAVGFPAHSAYAQAACTTTGKLASDRGMRNYESTTRR